MNSRVLYVGLGMVLLSSVAGCASLRDMEEAQREIRALQQQVSGISSNYSALSRRADNIATTVEDIRTRPLVEGSIMITKRDYPLDFGMVFGVVLSKYQNPGSRKRAEEEGNAVLLAPTNDRNAVQASILNDYNDDGKHTFGVDYIYPDEVDGKKIRRFRLERRELSDRVQGLLTYTIPIAPQATPK